MSGTIGFYGAGNMGKAIIQGLIQSKLYEPQDIFAYDAYTPILEKIHEDLGVSIVKDEVELAGKVDIILLAVKPNIITSVLEKISDQLNPQTIVISIAAGVTIEKIASAVPTGTKIVRVMPNTPALVGAGMSALAVNEQITDEEKEKVLAIFSSFGEAEFVAEYLIDAVVGVSGSAPAYVYMFIESLADGAVLAGMPRASAYKFAAQTVLGSAKMVMETGKHPGELKDMVCSPGGTTIAAVQSLESNGFRSTVIDAVLAAAEKNKNM